MARVAARQHGVVSALQLRQAGLSRSAVARRLQAGRLHRIHRGVYAVGHPRPPQEGLWVAALLACGSGNPTRGDGAVLDVWGAALSHRSAAELWDMLPRREGRIEVSVAGTGGRRQRRGVHIHRSRTLSAPAVTSQRGIAVSRPHRVLEDLRRSAATRGCPATVPGWELRRAERQAAVQGLLAWESPSGARTRSDLEDAFLELCRQRGLPTPLVNVRLGRFEVDFLWARKKLVVEADGYRYHRGRVAFEDDRARDLWLRERDYTVLRFSENQIAEEAERIGRLVEAELSRG